MWPGLTFKLSHSIRALAQESSDFIPPSLLNLANEQGIDLFPLQLDKPLIDQCPFDCIIHKLSDSEWINQLHEFVSQRPTKLILKDPPVVVQRLRSQITMLEVVNQLHISPQVSFHMLKQVLVESLESSLNSVSSEGISFPIIAKPLVAYGSADSHQMSLVFIEEGLNELNLEPPFVLLEFVDHGGVIFKVYVAGQHIQCVKRRSLSDIPEGGLVVSENLFSFSQISNVLRQALKLNIFNYDMIRDSRDENRYLVIDINYFPGYAKMPCYETILTDFFLDILQEKKNLVTKDCCDPI